MKRELLTVKELLAELRMSLKSIQWAYHKEEIPVQLFFLLSHCCTWIHLINSLGLCRTVWSAPLCAPTKEITRMKPTLLSVKEVAQELGVSAIDSTCVLERRDPRLSHQHNAALRSGTSPANLFGERLVEDRTATQRATAGRGRRRARKRPRTVTRGHYPQGSLQEVYRFHEFTLHPHH